RALGGDLEKLWRAGEQDLPAVGDAYVAATRQLENTDMIDDHAFARRPDGAAGVLGFTTWGGRVLPVWASLRDEYQRLLAKSATNLYDTGDALIQLAQAYGEVDTDAGDKLRESGRDLDEPPEEHLRPIPPEVKK
ncbi:MAG: hypothetical protein ACRD0P_34985, partial [Stackebrandtia sp.]